MPYSAAFSHSHVCSTPPPPNTQCPMRDLNNVGISYEPHREKTGFLPMRKQRRRSASTSLYTKDILHYFCVC